MTFRTKTQTVLWKDLDQDEKTSNVKIQPDASAALLSEIFLMW